VATLAEWVEGARPRTLGASVAPVLGATGLALAHGGVSGSLVALAAVVALALQVGVNYANDYSDGVRGTDALRLGPLRLVGGGRASPRAVLAAAMASFAVAAIAGLVIAAEVSWWLVAVGAVSILAAWGYTGGARPYGYLGFGELFVFVFFGLVETLGTYWVLARSVDGKSVAAACAFGAISSAILVANNLRDIPGDAEVGKRTLAVRLGDERTRLLYGLLVVSALVLAGVALGGGWRLALLVLPAIPLVVALDRVRRGAKGRALIRVLALTSWACVAIGAVLFVGYGLR
jgi:1,4-dihydroxy-2-naphthoate octaprenyltransferase